MKIPTLLFIIFLLNLATFCICKKALGDEGNIPPPSEQPFRGEGSQPPATATIQIDDYSDGINTDSSVDFKEIMATDQRGQKDQQLIHQSYLPTNDEPFGGGETSGGQNAIVKNEYDFVDMDLEKFNLEEIRGIMSSLDEDLGEQGNALAAVGEQSSQSNSMYPLASSKNLPKSKSSTNVGQQYQSIKRKAPLNYDENVSFLRDNRRKGDNKTPNLYRKPQHRQIEERIANENRKRNLSQIANNNLPHSNMAQNIRQSVAEQQNQQKQSHLLQYVDSNPSTEKKQKIETIQSKNHPQKLEYYQPSAIHGQTSQQEFNKNPEFNRHLIEKKPKPEAEFYGNKGSSTGLNPLAHRQQKEQMIQSQKGKSTIQSKQQFTHPQQQHHIRVAESIDQHMGVAHKPGIAQNVHQPVVEQKKQQPHLLSFVDEELQKQFESKMKEKKRDHHSLGVQPSRIIHGGSSQQKKPEINPNSSLNRASKELIILDSEPETKLHSKDGSSTGMNPFGQLPTEQPHQQRVQKIHAQKENTMKLKQQFSHPQQQQHIPKQAQQIASPALNLKELNKKLTENIIANSKVSENLLKIMNDLRKNEMLMANMEKQQLKFKAEKNALNAEKEKLNEEKKTFEQNSTLNLELKTKLTENIKTETKVCDDLLKIKEDLEDKKKLLAMLKKQHSELKDKKEVLKAEENRLKEEITIIEQQNQKL